MPRVEHVILYQYNELSKKAKERAREKWIERHGDSSEEIERFYIETLAFAGFPTCDIEFSLGCSQGDGMAFYTGGRMPNFSDPKRPWIWKVFTREHAFNYCEIERLWLRRMWKYFNKTERRDIYGLYKKYVVPGDISIDILIQKNSFGYRYSHHNTMSVTVEQRFHGNEPIENQRYIEDLLAKFEDCLKDDVKDMSKELEAEGYKIIEHRHSEEVVADDIMANELEFHENGEEA